MVLRIHMKKKTTNQNKRPYPSGQCDLVPRQSYFLHVVSNFRTAVLFMINHEFGIPREFSPPRHCRSSLWWYSRFAAQKLAFVIDSCGCFVVCLNPFAYRQNGRYFPDGILKCMFVNENFCIFFNIRVTFVPRDPIHNMSALAKIMALRRPGNKPLSQPMLTHLCWS